MLLGLWGEHDEVPRRSRLLIGAVQHLSPSEHGREKIGEVLGAVKPGVIYFTDNGVGRDALMVVDLDSAGQAPHMTQPLMLAQLQRVSALSVLDVARGTSICWPGQVLGNPDRRDSSRAIADAATHQTTPANAMNTNLRVGKRSAPATYTRSREQSE